MRGPLRRRFADADGNPGPPPTWRRVHAQGLTADLTVLVLPYVGSTWRRRGCAYWFNRLAAVVILAVPAAAFAGLDFLILWGEHRRGGYSAVFWATAVFLLLAAGWGAATVLLFEEFPLSSLRRSADWLPRAAGAVGQFLLVAVFLLATPGMWLAALADQLRPRPNAEKLALADLEQQLHDKKTGHLKPQVTHTPQQAAQAWRRQEATADWFAEYNASGSLRWPPREQLPPGMTIEPLTMLSTSWYERGGGYWVRRVLVLLLWIFVMFLMSAIVVGIADGAGGGHRNAAFWAVIALEAALTAATLGYASAATRRARRMEMSPSALRAVRAASLARTVRTGHVIRVVGIVMLVLFVVGAIAEIQVLEFLALAPLVLLWFLVYGVTVLVLIELCRPQPGYERTARKNLETRLRTILESADQ
jgi:hypothetical protein